MGLVLAGETRSCAALTAHQQSISCRGGWARGQATLVVKIADSTGCANGATEAVLARRGAVLTGTRCRAAEAAAGAHRQTSVPTPRSIQIPSQAARAITTQRAAREARGGAVHTDIADADGGVGTGKQTAARCQPNIQ